MCVNNYSCGLKWQNYVEKKLTANVILSFAILSKAEQKSLIATWHSKFKMWSSSISSKLKASSGRDGVAGQTRNRNRRRKSSSQLQNLTLTSFWRPQIKNNKNINANDNSGNHIYRIIFILHLTKTDENM